MINGCGKIMDWRFSIDHELNMNCIGLLLSNRQLLLKALGGEIFQPHLCFMLSKVPLPRLWSLSSLLQFDSEMQKTSRPRQRHLVRETSSETYKDLFSCTRNASPRHWRGQQTWGPMRGRGLSHPASRFAGSILALRWALTWLSIESMRVYYSLYSV